MTNKSSKKNRTLRFWNALCL